MWKKWMIVLVLAAEVSHNQALGNALIHDMLTKHPVDRLDCWPWFSMGSCQRRHCRTVWSHSGCGESATSNVSYRIRIWTGGTQPYS